MKLAFGRCQVYKINIARCLTQREQEYYNYYCDGISAKKLKEELGTECYTYEKVAEFFHIKKEQVEQLLKDQMSKQDFKEFLLEEISKFPQTDVREIVSAAADKQYNRVVWFENECVRRCDVDLKEVPLLDQFLILKCGSETLKGVLEQVIDKGVNLNDKHYIFYTSSTGQMKDSEITMVEEQYWNDNKYSLMCGLSEERINENGGINMGKYFAAKALNISNSVLYDSGVLIDEVIIVPDFETMVDGMVNDLNVETLEIEQRKKSVSVQHMDGAGIFLPGVFPCSCQIRGGWLKGAIFPFDFHRFIEEYRDELSEKHMIDAWGDLVTVDEFLSAKMILTDSQLKMQKYYRSMQEYRECFKKAGLSITINNCAQHEPESVVKVAYQPFQTIPRSNLTDKAIELLAEKTIKAINDAKNDPVAALKLMGVELTTGETKNFPPLAAAIVTYPKMLNDIHVRKTMKSALLSARKQAQGCKLILDGFWSYICPDLFAFCQWLFCGQDTPDGLIPEGYIYNHYYDQTEYTETCCLRYPHLSDCEHGIRKVLHSEECEKWFSGTDTIVSSHDLISKVLQADWDGDHICLVHDEAFLNVLDRQKYPLVYEMTKALPSVISNQAVMNCLMSSFQNENIGYVSNSITKIFNSATEPDTKLVKILCAYNNFVIDYFKTQKSMDLKEYAEIYEQYKDSGVVRCPYFFHFAKDKKLTQCETFNTESNSDRICRYVSRKTASGMSKIEYGENEKFQPEILKRLQDEVKRQSEEYSQMRLLLAELKSERTNWYKKIKDDLKIKESEQEIFNIYCRIKFSKIFSDPQKIVDYLVDIEYYTEENMTDKKDILWSCYGDILYDNLCRNLEHPEPLPVRRAVQKTSQKKQCDIEESRDKAIQETNKLVKVSISQNVYDYLMDVSTIPSRKNDKYILYVLYVLLQRQQKKNGTGYVSIAKGSKQRGKITCSTIDQWIESACTVKGLAQLEEHGYIKREQFQSFQKIWLKNIPTAEGEALFSAESNNPLLDLYEYNGDRKIKKCAICSKKFIATGNTKTCSSRKCSTMLRGMKKNEKDEK